MIAVAEALVRIVREAEPLGPEAVPLSGAAGRTLAREIRADADFPPFDTTAMDGYAVAGIQPTGLYRARASTVAAGDEIPRPVVPGEAVRVMTGAPLPKGSIAVVPIEEASPAADGVSLKAPKPRAHIRSRGEIFREGDTLLPAGTRLSPEALLLCATVGAGSVPVWRLPRCAVAATGAEIVSVSAQPKAGQIRNGNSPALVGALALRGIRALEFPAIPDRRPDLEEFFSTLIVPFDLAMTTGGVSAGDFDVTAKAAEAAGFQILFHAVAIKPGKPIAFGRRGRTLWFGLPGNPVSAMTTFEVFVAAALDRMDGRPVRTPIQAELTGPVRHRAGREAYLDARLFSDGNRLFAEPLPTRGSHDLRCQAHRNALLIVPAEGGNYREGELLACLPLRELPF